MYNKSLNQYPNDREIICTPAAHTVYLSCLGIEEIYGEKKYILFISVGTTDTFIKTFIVAVPHI